MLDEKTTEFLKELKHAIRVKLLRLEQAQERDDQRYENEIKKLRSKKPQNRSGIGSGIEK